MVAIPQASVEPLFTSAATIEQFTCGIKLNGDAFSKYYWRNLSQLFTIAVW
jgi:hypothetical protein